MPVSALALRGCRLFSAAAPQLLADIGAQMRIVQLRRREVLVAVGARQFRGLGVVLAGRMQAVEYTTDGREVGAQTREPGEAFGHVQLLAHRPAEVNWMAQQPSAVAVMDAPVALQWLAHPQVCLAAAREMADELNRHLVWQKLLSVHPASARVCAWLVETSHGRDKLALPTHAEIAWQLHTTRETVTRTLQRLQGDGTIQRVGEHWQVLQPAALADAARGEGPARGAAGEAR
jgi:CRP-like cAMP-binding protein